MNEITVTSQQQLDNLPHDYHGRIYIKFGTPYDRAIVRRKYDFASVVARGNSQINQKSDASKINASSNARVVHDPHTIDEYVDFYGIENSNGKAKLFKAVRKHNGVYRWTGMQILCIQSGNQLRQTAFALTLTKIAGAVSIWPISTGVWHTETAGLISQSSKSKRT